MTFHFTQEISIRKTGFGNTVMAELGVPTPIAEEILPGSRLVRFDQHPYLARSGWGNPDGSVYPDQPVDSCTGVLIYHLNGITEEIMVKSYDEHPTFWGMKGQEDEPGLELLPNVEVDTTLTQVTFEVDYDSTIYAAYDLSRASFQYVDVEKDGEYMRFRNIACIPKSSWRQAVATFRMWGQTYSWGSEEEKMLTIPFREVRKVSAK